MESKFNPSQRKWKRKYQEERVRSVQVGHLKMALFGYSVEGTSITLALQHQQYLLNGLVQQRLISHTCAKPHAIKSPHGSQVCIFGTEGERHIPNGICHPYHPGKVKWLSPCALGS